jgi:hypothetical protein
MIRVTIEMIPHGVEELKHTLGEIVIINTIDNPKRPRLGNYKILFEDKSINEKKEIIIKNYERSRGIWALLEKILKNIQK